MLLVVTFVGMLIHIYSTGYMAHEGGYYRFFSLSESFRVLHADAGAGREPDRDVRRMGRRGPVQLFADRLLVPEAIGGRRRAKKPSSPRASATSASPSAFCCVFWTFGSLNFGDDVQEAAQMPAEALAHAGVLTAICLLLFTGAIGKSAQLPLYVWLPDAMEGPTPVSALIHAATMVTAGVYMVARMNPLFSRAPMAMLVVAIVGAVTAFYSATIGLVQTDIKKVLAYSTVSQLGYMFLGCGVGAYAAGIFHLMTHAFFKGLLFLAAGSVIHAMGGEQDMRNMGGLRKKIPVTYWTMFIGTLAIAGIPGFAGFFSKDEILEAAQRRPARQSVLWLLGLVGAGLTSFYMFRLVFLTFFGKQRYDEHKVHVHESPKNMTVPLIILAILSIFGGWFAAPHLMGGTGSFRKLPAPGFRGVCAGQRSRGSKAARNASASPAMESCCCTRSLGGP